MRYYYMVTLEWAVNGGHGEASSSRTGTVEAWPGCTRQELTAEALRKARSTTDAPGNAVVAFFSLEPDELAT
jgi:hypothetical protein